MSGLIKELRLNLLGKIFLTSAAAYTVGKLTNLKIRGTAEEVQAVADAMLSSRRFQQELEDEDATVESVIDKLGLKHASARQFEAILGIPWPL